ncbi:MAG: histidinol dehydrogenase [Saprospiraceae bacterium]
MKKLTYPNLAELVAALTRPGDEQAAERREKVASMLAAIRAEGDAAVRRLARQFDGFTGENFAVSEEEFALAEQLISPELQNAIRQAYANIRRFHDSQKEEIQWVETMPDVICWRKSVAIEKVGLYIPGGTAPLFSTVLMLGVPAQIAGCQEVILCSPPQTDGSVHPAVLFAASLCGIEKVFKIGGVQAIGAMACGTETVPQVWKIFGPGNPWVTAAKQLVSLEGVAIDLPAGPSEVCVVADSTADPRFVAADLLSQAEHGADSQVLFISDSGNLIQQVENELEKQLADLPRRDFAEKSLANSTAILVENLDTAMKISNLYAPEHLILQIAEPEKWAEKVVNAGSVFLGHYSPESAGDYASGTNHTLPTGGWARASAGVSFDSFLKKITFQHISPQGLKNLSPAITTMARAEGLEAHARAVDVRFATI